MCHDSTSALPGEDFAEAGRDLAEALEAAKILEEASYDCFDVDAGTYDSWYWPHPPAYFGYKGIYLDDAAELKKVASVPVIAAGRMDDPQMALKAVQDGVIDGVGYGRPFLADPDYINKLRCGREDTIRPCVGCHDGCFGRFLFEGGVGSCAVNPECGRELFVGIQPGIGSKKVVVIGGGPGGMEAARVSAIRGYDVVLFEKQDHLGGNLHVASQPSFKSDDRDLIEWYERQLHALKVDIRLNTPADEEAVAAESPDVIYVAEGARPIIPDIPGVEQAVLAQDVLLGTKEAGKDILVIGGGLVGCETALHLAQSGSRVRIVEALPGLLQSGVKVPHMNALMLGDLLRFHRIKPITDSALVAVRPEGAVIRNDGEESLVECDQVVLAIGYRPDAVLYDSLAKQYPYVYKLGDGRKFRNVRGAIWAAYEVSRTI